MSKPYAQEHGWTPVRRGEIYCSPLCGARCTHAAFELETQRAAELAFRLGAGWTPHVWENMGWFGEARYGAPSFLSVSWNYHRQGTERYYAYLNGDPEGGVGGHWTAGEDTPEEAIQAALAEFAAERARLDDVARRLGDLDPRILGDYPGGIVALQKGKKIVYLFGYRYPAQKGFNGLQVVGEPQNATGWNSPKAVAKAMQDEYGLEAWPLPKPKEK